jgi:ATP-dependent HslUV protease ATP-binding subunit HslU
LTAHDLEKILTEPEHALLRQYIALLGADHIEVDFEAEAITRIAEIAAKVNEDTEDIGARRLHTLMERVLEDLLFEAPDIGQQKIVITPHYVDEKVGAIVQNKDLSKYIL